MEDSNAGFEFFKNVSERKGISCESAGKKSNLFSTLKKVQGKDELCVIADGAAIGPEMNQLYERAQQMKNIKLYLPESFEWIILKSGIIKGKEIQMILEHPENYIDCKDFFSWERFFTRILIDKTEGSHLSYKKSSLNKTYLHYKNRKMILRCIEEIELEEIKSDKEDNSDE
ncbi:MAG: hypothetical protein LUF92_04200 [Clostridiales bacterium]|nr:hypothetical protein [Clostridiales bacterium]